MGQQYICDHASKCLNAGCNHRRPHPRMKIFKSWCEPHNECDYEEMKGTGAKCIPLKNKREELVKIGVWVFIGIYIVYRVITEKVMK